MRASTSTDPAGNLYLTVANAYSEVVKIYAPPYTAPPTMTTDGKHVWANFGGPSINL